MPDRVARRPGRAGRWWSRRRRCGRTRGGPGSCEPQVRSAFRSSSSRPEAAEVELGVEGEAGVAAGEHEPVAAEPVRVGRVVPHHLLEQQVRRRRQAHRGAGVAVADLLDGVHRQDPDGVHRPVVEVGPVEVRRGRRGHGVPLGGRRRVRGRTAAARAYSWLADRLDPPSHRSALLPRNPRDVMSGRSGLRVTRTRRRAARPTARREPARRGRGVRRADQAAGHRAAAADHRAGDVLRRARASRRSAWWSRPSSAARCRPARRRRCNCVYDRDIDEQMRRTRRRALPRHIVSPRAALVFGLVLGVVSPRWSWRCGSTGSRPRWRWRPTRSTSSSTRCCSSAGPRRTSSGAGSPAASRR